MVRVGVRVKVAVCVAVAFRVWTEFTVSTGKRSLTQERTPERNGIGDMHARAASGAKA